MKPISTTLETLRATVSAIRERQAARLRANTADDIDVQELEATIAAKERTAESRAALEAPTTDVLPINRRAAK